MAPSTSWLQWTSTGSMWDAPRWLATCTFAEPASAPWPRCTEARSATAFAPATSAVPPRVSCARHCKPWKPSRWSKRTNGNLQELPHFSNRSYRITVQGFNDKILICLKKRKITIFLKLFFPIPVNLRKWTKNNVI